MEWGDTAGWLAEEDNAIEPSLSGGGGGGGRVQGTRIALGQAASGAVCLGAGKDRVPEAYVVVVHGRRRGRRLRVRAMLKLNNGRTAVSPLRGSGAVGAEAYLEGIDSSRWAAAVAAAAAAAASTGTVSRLSLKHLLRCFDFYSIDRKFCNGTNLNTLYQYHWSMRLSTGSWHSWYPVKHMEIKVVSIENSEVLADGSKGVVKVRGPQVMKGYYKDHFFQFTDVKMMGCSFQISPILIVDESFTVDNGLLTSTLKIRRDKAKEVYNVGSTLRLAKAGCKRDYIIPSIAGTLIEDGWRCETNQQRKETGNRLEELKQRKRQINEGPHVIDK
uniref:AMP-dependent synthetase/ligase domain-containing protein n=1 Tax=Oryza glumipatula TaxID=40148 RepID=A0A0E0B570_9ORYZ